MDIIAISVREEFERLRRQLDGLGQKQLPFAAAMALNDTARLVKTRVTEALPSVFDRPTVFTMNALGMTGARKGRLEAAVFVKDIQAGYLRLEETGGERGPEPARPVAVPVDLTRDRYGGIGRGTLKRLRGRKDVFVGTIKGIAGFWQRGPLGSIRLLVELRPQARYRPRFGYRARVAATVPEGFATFLPKRLAAAIASAK